LDFKNLKFLSHGLCRHAVLLPSAKFRCHLEFLKISIFGHVTTAFAMYRISSKPDDFSLTYGDLTIFKMAAVGHLGF